MLVLKAIGLVVCIVVAVRWKRSRLPLALLLIVAALLLRGLECGHDRAMDRNNPVPTQPTEDPRRNFVPTGPIVPHDCPNRPNCIPPPGAPVDAGP